jgi:hypothetical protein
MKLTEQELKQMIRKTLNEGQKKFYEKDNVASAKYTVSKHDGVQKHKDGSEAYDIKTFKNRKDRDAYIQDLIFKGYKYTKGPMYESAKRKKLNENIENDLYNDLTAICRKFLENDMLRDRVLHILKILTDHVKSELI